MKKCLSFIFLLLSIACQGEELKYWISEYFSTQGTVINLEKSNLISNSEKVSTDSLKFIRDLDYHIDYQNGSITILSDKLLQAGQAKIEYKIIPSDFLEPLYLYQIAINPDSTYMVQKRQRKPIFLENNKLLINGSKTFALSFSENKDFDVNQSLYLKLSGEIADNIFVEAQLSDSNSPISTEGNSQELSSLDKVYISLFNDNFELAFGDLAHEITNTSYINYLAQFEGLKLGLFQSKNNIYSGRFNLQNRIWTALAVSKGKNSTYKFNCVEGKQGPYFIYVANNDQYVSIIANSESLFIDGVKAERGIDYFIDYSEGSVTFENLVTSETEIYITFEYSDEKYRNNLYIGSSQFKITDYFNISLHAIHREDDKENPLEDIHTSEDLEAFAVAGDSIIYANGVYEVELGQGNYIAETNSQGQTIYTYVGTEGQGNYNIYFSYLGQGQGSYYQKLPNQFEYIGAGQGDYEPVRKLNPPQKLSNYDIVIRFGLESIYLEMESLLTYYDQNTFSSKDDSDNQGNISKVSLNLVKDKELWTTNNQISYEYKSKNANPISDLASPLEISYGGKETDYDSLKTNTMLITSNFSLNNYFSTIIDFKSQKVKELYDSDLVKTDLFFNEHTYSPELRYIFTEKKINYDLADLDKFKYTNKSLQLGKKVLYLQSKFNYFEENSQEEFSQNQKTGYEYLKKTYSLNTINLTSVNVSTSYWQDERSSLNNNEWQKVSTSQTVNSNLLLSFKNSNTNIEYSFREIDGKNDNIEDNVFNKITINSSHSVFNNGLDINYNYKINNLEFYPKVRELQYIGDGAGAYDSLGFYQDEGDWDWLYVNSGEPELSTELNIGFNSYLRLNRFTQLSFWKNLNAEFRSIITEDTKTSEKLKLYFLNPDVLMNKNTTLYGRQNFLTSYGYTSDNKKFNYRLSFEWDKILDNRYQNESKTNIKIIDNEFMMRRMTFGNVGAQFVYREEADTRYQQVINEYSSIIKYQNTFLSNYLYNGNLKGKLERGNADNEINDYEIRVADFNNIITANLAKKYLIQINTNFIHTWDNSDSSFVFLPEKRAGFSLKWSISAKYSYNKYVTLNLTYLGNKYPQNEMENNLNIEIKAEF